MKKIISTDSAPKAIGPYSQAVLAGDFLFVSGQLGMHPETQAMGETVQEQAEQALLNMGAILKQAGLDFDAVVKTTVLLADIADFATVNEIYARFFKSNYPARAAYAVASLPRGARVEIEAVAYRS